MFCEACGKEFDEDWRKDKKNKILNPIPKFCSRSCSNKRKPSIETKEKTSKSLLKRNKEQKKIPWNKNLPDSDERKKKFSSYISKAENLLDLSTRTISKIMKRLNLSCSKCGFYHKGVVLDIHHINPKKNGGSDLLENLAYICPNCHRLVHSGVVKPEDLTPMSVFVGEKWKDVYFSKKTGE